MLNVASENLGDEKMDSPHRILVVDDEPTVRFVIKTYLKRIGFHVEEAEGGESAFVKIQEFDPQIVLLDVMMPGIAGNELVEPIKEWKPKIEVIMVTGLDRKELEAECLSKGAFVVLVKPITLEVLKTTIRKSLEKIQRKPRMLDNARKMPQC